MSRPRVCIATLDPFMTAGVRSMARFVYETAEEAGYDPYIACNRVTREHDVRIQDIMLGDWSRTVESTSIEGMEVIGIPRYLPEFEFLQYVLNRNVWRQQIDEADICFAVGGNNQVCYPFYQADRAYGCWVATLLWDDRKDRVRESSLAWKIRDHLSRPFLEVIERRLFASCHNILSLSDYTADRIDTEYGIDREDIDVVPYPIDTEKFRPEPSREPDGTGPTVLFVGRFNDPRKNVGALVESFASVADRDPGATLELVGATPDQRILDLVERFDVGDSVGFVDFVPNDELSEHYSRADVFVIPSSQEGLGIVGLEAMACGTPVVATRCGGPEEYIDDGETGYLVPRGDTDAMTRYINRLLESEEQRSRFGENARRVIEERFDKEVLKERFVATFEELAEI